MSNVKQQGSSIYTKNLLSFPSKKIYRIMVDIDEDLRKLTHFITFLLFTL